MSLTNSDIKIFQGSIDLIFENALCPIPNNPEDLRFQIKNADEQIKKLNKISEMLKQTPEENIELQAFLKCNQTLEIVITDLDIKREKCEIEYKKYLDKQTKQVLSEADEWLKEHYSRLYDILDILIENGFVVKTKQGFDWKYTQNLLAGLMRSLYHGTNIDNGYYFTCKGKKAKSINSLIGKANLPKTEWHLIKKILPDLEFR